MTTVVILNIDYFKRFIDEKCNEIKDISLHDWLYRIVLKYVMENEICVFKDVPNEYEKQTIHVIKALEENNKLMRFKEDNNFSAMIDLIIKWYSFLKNSNIHDFQKIHKYNFIQAFDSAIKHENILNKKNNRINKI